MPAGEGLSFAESPVTYILLALSLFLGGVFAVTALREKGHGPHKESGAEILRRRQLKRTMRRMGMKPQEDGGKDSSGKAD